MNFDEVKVMFLPGINALFYHELFTQQIRKCLSNPRFILDMRLHSTKPNDNQTYLHFQSATDWIGVLPSHDQIDFGKLNSKSYIKIPG